MTAGGRNQAEGFLLLEMLVALAVVAVMGALMSSFLGQLSSINRLESEIATQTEADAAAAYLQRLLEGARPARVLDAEINTNPVFDGTQSSVRFAAVTRRGLYSLALRDVNIFLQRSSGASSLHHTIGARRLSGGKPKPHGQAITILDKVDAVEFQYGDGENWSDSWGKDDILPRAVRIRITIVAGPKDIVSETVARIY